jgi:HlyD family secretion protein
VKKLIIIVVVLAAGGAGVFFWFRYNQNAVAAPPVTTGKVERSLLRITVSSTGKVVSNLDVDIKCKASGEIVELPYDVSAPVKKGDLILRLDPNDENRRVRQAQVALRASKAKLETAVQNLKVAEATLLTDKARAESALKTAEVQAKDARTKADRLRELLTKKLASQEEYDTATTAVSQADSQLENARTRMEELKTQTQAIEIKRQEKELADAQVASDQIALELAQQGLADTKVVAPIDGVVSARQVQIGQIVSSGISNVGGGTAVLTISDLSRIFVIAAVDESDIGKVEPNQPVNITADGFPGMRFKGSVVQIATRGQNVSNVVTFDVKVEVLSRNKHVLKPEMTANVEIIAAEKKDALLAPTDSVVQRKGEYFATVSKPDGSTEERPVKIGLSDGTKTEVLEGLQEGETVVFRKGEGDSRFRGGRGPMGPARMMGGR